MAQIRDNDNNRVYSLRAHHTFGRCSNRADTIVSNPIMSRIHLALEWNGQGWTARDLSKNGTWLRGDRMHSNHTVAINLGDQLHLGSPDMPAWELVDDSAPSSTLAGLNDATPSLDLQPFVFLPDHDHPEAVVIYSYHRHCWMLYSMGHDHSQPFERVLRHGDRLNYEGKEWSVFLAETEQATEVNIFPRNKLEDIEFVFDLSLDEEHTSLQLSYRQELVNLGERSHHYLLLHLARQRAAEAAQGLDQKSQGWIDNEQLKKDLGIEMSHINIMIFRARKQIADSIEVSLDSERLIERGKGRMRFGCPRFRIYKGEQLTYAMPESGSVGV